MFDLKYDLKLYLGDEGDPSLHLPPQNDECRGLAVLVGQLLELGVDEEVGQLLAPGQVGGAERGVADHEDVVLQAETPEIKEERRCNSVCYFAIYLV